MNGNDRREGCHDQDGLVVSGLTMVLVKTHSPRTEESPFHA